MNDTLVHGSYEYAGFKYQIHDDEGRMTAIPHAGQHKAASKEKHRRAALDCFEQDYQWSKRLPKRDYHAETALEVYGEVTPITREKAKILTFRALYGANE